MRRKGSITIYAALILGVMMALIITCLTSSRMAAARAQIASAAQVGLFSAFGSYDRELLEKYEVFGLNMGGSSSDADLASFSRTVQAYMDYVLKQNSQNLRLSSLGLSGYRLLTDEGGEPFFRQAVLYEKEYAESREDYARLEKWMGYYAEAEGKIESAAREEDSDWFGRYASAMEEAERLSREILMTEPEDLLTDGEEGLYIPYEETDFTTVTDPVPVIQSISETGILSFLLPAADEEAYPYNSSPLFSQRDSLSGTGIFDGFVPDDSAESRLLFQCYINEKLGNYLRPKEGFPAYQMEYILEREGSDRENLEKTVKRIFLLRLGITLDILEGNETYRAELRNLSDTICSVFIVPPDWSTVYDTLKYCWAYGAALCETNEILSGGSVPFEDDTEVYIPLSGLYDIMAYFDSGGRNTGEGGYEDYLVLFMAGLNKGEKLSGVLDAVEGAVRSLGRASFYIDHCLVDAEILALVRANGRKTFSVTKTYGYD